MPIDRESAATVAFVAFFVALTSWYDLADMGGQIPLLEGQGAFYLAVGSWIALYLYCGGRDWDMAESWERAVFGLSWAILLGSAFLPQMQTWLDSYTWLPWVATGVHAISAYLIYSNRGT